MTATQFITLTINMLLIIAVIVYIIENLSKEYEISLVKGILIILGVISMTIHTVKSLSSYYWPPKTIAKPITKSDSTHYKKVTVEYYQKVP